MSASALTVRLASFVPPVTSVPMMLFSTLLLSPRMLMLAEVAS